MNAPVVFVVQVIAIAGASGTCISHPTSALMDAYTFRLGSGEFADFIIGIEIAGFSEFGSLLPS